MAMVARLRRCARRAPGCQRPGRCHEPWVAVKEVKSSYHNGCIIIVVTYSN